MENNSLLKRYTKLSYLFEMLETRKIKFLDPVHWEDKNDIFTLNKYKEQNKLKTLLALCFTAAKKDNHHFWRSYVSCESEGVFIVFKKDEFIISLKKQVKSLKNEELLDGLVQYPSKGQIQSIKNDVKLLPFLKRFGYASEEEFRLIYTNRNKIDTPKSFNFSLDTIDRICLNPFISDDLVNTTTKLIHSIKGCKDIRVTNSGLIRSDEWKQIIDAKFSL